MNEMENQIVARHKQLYLAVALPTEAPMIYYVHEPGRAYLTGRAVHVIQLATLVDCRFALLSPSFYYFSFGLVVLDCQQGVGGASLLALGVRPGKGSGG